MSCPHCPTGRVVDPPKVIFRDFFHPQVVQIIHPIEIVNRHHCVPIPEHIFTFNVKDEFCPGPLTGPVAHIKRVNEKNAKRNKKRK